MIYVYLAGWKISTKTHTHQIITKKRSNKKKTQKTNLSRLKKQLFMWAYNLNTKLTYLKVLHTWNDNVNHRPNKIMICITRFPNWMVWKVHIYNVQNMHECVCVCVRGLLSRWSTLYQEKRRRKSYDNKKESKWIWFFYCLVKWTLHTVNKKEIQKKTDHFALMFSVFRKSLEINNIWNCVVETTAHDFQSLCVFFSFRFAVTQTVNRDFFEFGFY